MADIFEDRMNLVANSSILGLILGPGTDRDAGAEGGPVGNGGYQGSFLSAFTLLPANDVSLNMLAFAFLLVLRLWSTMRSWWERASITTSTSVG